MLGGQWPNRKYLACRYVSLLTKEILERSLMCYCGSRGEQINVSCVYDLMRFGRRVLVLRTNCSAILDAHTVWLCFGSRICAYLNMSLDQTL